MLTTYTIFRANGERETHSVELPQDPGLERLEAIVLPVLGANNWMERVGLTYDGQPVDMFVDEHGLLTDQPLNLAATMIYQAHIAGYAVPVVRSALPYIVGDAVLFHRRVWY